MGETGTDTLSAALKRFWEQVALCGLQPEKWGCQDEGLNYNQVAALKCLEMSQRGEAMSADADGNDLARRIKELEEENARLRESATRPVAITCRETEYKGNPMLTFEGPFRPFSMGVKKLNAVKECWPHVEDFLNRHNRAATGRADPTTTDDDGTI